MKKLTKIEQKMFDWDNELRFYSSEYSDEKVIEVAQKAIDFAYANFKGKEELYEDCEYEFEPKIENVALGIDSYLQKKTKKQEVSYN